ncbi:hypothetical protein [Lysinibacillus pakistanensis]|uniref:hypothetical protein n=1 Tax=Lysinibacillus pakistanensis TaxID=759811 RepID=UPI003D28C063
MNLTALAILDNYEIKNVTPFKSHNLETYSCSISNKIPMINIVIYYGFIMENIVVNLEITKNINKNFVTTTDKISKVILAAKLLILRKKKFGYDTKMEVLRGQHRITLDKVKGEEVYE